MQSGTQVVDSEDGAGEEQGELGSLEHIGDDGDVDGGVDLCRESW